MSEADPTDFWAQFRAPWVLRLVLTLAVLASWMGRAIEPGLRGVATHAAFQRVVVGSSLLANALVIAALVVVGGAVNELTRRHEIPGGSRWIGFLAGMATFSLSIVAISPRAPKGIFALPLAAFALIAMLTAAVEALRFPHARAVGMVFASLSIAVALRLLAYVLASHDERGIDYYRVARALALVALTLEASAAVLAALWLARRGRAWSKGLVGAALLLALAAALSPFEDAGAPAQSILRALAADVTPYDASIARASIALGVFGTLLALLSIAERSSLLPISAALGLVLLGRGAADAPLRALVATTGALWLLLATRDPKCLDGLRDLARFKSGQSGDSRRPEEKPAA